MSKTSKIVALSSDETKQVETKLEVTKKIEKPISELVKDWSTEKLEQRLDDLAKISGDMERKVEVNLDENDIKFLRYMLNTIKFKAMEAYAMIGLSKGLNFTKQEIRTKKQEISVSTLQGLWHFLVNKYEGRGMKEARNYVAVSNKFSNHMADIQKMNSEMQAIGTELAAREQLKVAQELEASKPEKKKRGRPKKK